MTGPRARKTGIEKYVESWLPRNVDEKSEVFVYFSGHGAPDPTIGRAYLMPWDGDAQFLSNTAYPIKRLYENSENSRPGESSSRSTPVSPEPEGGQSSPRARGRSSAISMPASPLRIR